MRLPFQQLKQRKVVRDTYDLEDARKASALAATACCTGVPLPQQVVSPPLACLQGRISIECQWLPAFAAAT